jgi:hypothetical protein
LHFAHDSILCRSGRVGFGHLVEAVRADDDVTVSAAELEPLISREEVLATMFMVADIAADVKGIRRILEENDEEEEDQ